jgi:hypothetical protein
MRIVIAPADRHNERQRKTEEKTMQGLKAGAGKCKIAFRPEILPTSKRENYTKILDLPSARILILEQEERYVFAVYELANMDREVNGQILELIKKEAGVALDHIFFHMNHVHSTPHGWGPFDKKNPAPGEAEKMEPFYRAIIDATECALKQALDGMRPVQVGTGKGICRSCIVNRNVPTKDGWWIGAGEDGPVDDGIDILRFDDEEGQTVALLYVYNVVPSIYDYSTRDFEEGLERWVSADLAGYANAFIEEEFSGAVAMYLTGAAGDVWPSFSAMYTVVGRGGSIREKDMGDRRWRSPKCRATVSDSRWSWRRMPSHVRNWMRRWISDLPRLNWKEKTKTEIRRKCMQ